MTYSAGIFNGTATFDVGARTAASTQFDGKMYDVNIFNRALSATEVFEIYSHGMNGTSKRHIE